MLNPEYIGDKLWIMVKNDGCEPKKFLKDVIASFEKYLHSSTETEVVRAQEVPVVKAQEVPVVQTQDLPKELVQTVTINQLDTFRSYNYRTKDCKYFKYGVCKHGSDCSYRHVNQVKLGLHSELPSRRFYQNQPNYSSFDELSKYKSTEGLYSLQSTSGSPFGCYSTISSSSHSETEIPVSRSIKRLLDGPPIESFESSKRSNTKYEEYN